MSCETSRATYHARVAAQPAVAATFGGSAEAARALDEIFAIARAQAERQLAARSGEQSRIAALRALAEDQQAEEATLALFAEMRDGYGLRPPAHARSGLPRKDAQYGYALVYRTLRAIGAGLALPELARLVRDALLRRRTQETGAERVPLSTAPRQQHAIREAHTTAPVQLSTGEARGEYEHLLAVRATKQRRLQHLQVKQARMGISSDPSIIMEAEDLEQEIAMLNAQVAAYAQAQTIASSLLSPEQQREAILALAAIAGVPPERIRLVDIVLGSIVLVVELPVGEAAHLLALQHLAPQALVAAGFARAALEPDNDPADLALLVDRAARLLVAPEHGAGVQAPPAGGSPTVRLRVTLAEGHANFG
jgi:hypothetical protein